MSQLKSIRTEAEYSAAIERFETLLDTQPGQPEYDERDVLAVLIERYEDEHFPVELPDPIEARKLRMEQSGLTHLQ